jgi:hypothetical protein
MEDVIYSLGHGESQLIHHWGNFFDDLEGSISFGFELGLLMMDF